MQEVLALLLLLLLAVSSVCVVAPLLLLRVAVAAGEVVVGAKQLRGTALALNSIPSALLVGIAAVSDLRIRQARCSDAVDRSTTSGSRSGVALAVRVGGAQCGLLQRGPVTLHEGRVQHIIIHPGIAQVSEQPSGGGQPLVAQ